MKDIQTGNAVQLLFQVVQADDGAGAFRLLRADAAEGDDIGTPELAATAAANESEVFS